MEAQPKFFAVKTKTESPKSGKRLWVAIGLIGLFCLISASVYVNTKREKNAARELKSAEQVALYIHALLESYEVSWPDKDRFCKLQMVDPDTPPLEGEFLNTALRNEQKQLDLLLKINPPDLLWGSHNSAIKQRRSSIEALKAGRKVDQHTVSDKTVEEQYAWDLYFILMGCRPEEYLKDTYILTPKWYSEAMSRLKIFYEYKLNDGRSLIDLRLQKIYNVSTPFFSMASEKNWMLNVSIYNTKNHRQYETKWKIDFSRKALIPLNLDAQSIENETIP